MALDLNAKKLIFIFLGIKNSSTYDFYNNGKLSWVLNMVIPYKSFTIRKMSMSIHWTKKSSSYKKTH